MPCLALSPSIRIPPLCGSLPSTALPSERGRILPITPPLPRRHREHTEAYEELPPPRGGKGQSCSLLSALPRGLGRRAGSVGGRRDQFGPLGPQLRVEMEGLLQVQWSHGGYQDCLDSCKLSRVHHLCVLAGFHQASLLSFPPAFPSAPTITSYPHAHHITHIWSVSSLLLLTHPTLLKQEYSTVSNNTTHVLFPRVCLMPPPQLV